MIRGAKHGSVIIPTMAVAEAAYFDYATVKKGQQGAEVKILSVLDRARKRLRVPCIAKEQTSKILSCF